MARSATVQRRGVADPRPASSLVCSTEGGVVIPGWASERIGREVDAYLARGGSPQDTDLTRVAGLLRAWPVYGDLGGRYSWLPTGQSTAGAMSRWQWGQNRIRGGVYWPGQRRPR